MPVDDVGLGELFVPRGKQLLVELDIQRLILMAMGHPDESALRAEVDDILEVYLGTARRQTLTWMLSLEAADLRSVSASSRTTLCDIEALCRSDIVLGNEDFADECVDMIIE